MCTQFQVYSLCRSIVDRMFIVFGIVGFGHLFSRTVFDIAHVSVPYRHVMLVMALTGAARYDSECCTLAQPRVPYVLILEAYR